MQDEDARRSSLRPAVGCVDPGTGKDTRVVIGGSVAAAGTAYLFLTVGARILGPEEFAPISSLWTIQFLALAVALIPVEHLAIRAGTLGEPPPYRQAAVVGLFAAIAAGVFAFVDRRTLFMDGEIFVLLTVLSVIALTVFAIGRGLAAGAESYRAYGVITGAQSAVRFAVGAPVLMITTSATAGGWVMALSPLVALAWRPLRKGRLRRRPTRLDALFLIGLVGANAFAQMLLLGGPIVVAWIGASAIEISIFFVVLTLFRAPVAVANNAVARVLPPFTRLAAERRFGALRSWSLRLAYTGLVLAALAAGFGWWLGPSVTQLLFGGGFRPTTLVAASVAAGSTLATVAIIGNQILTGLNRTFPLALSWFVGVVVASGVVAANFGSVSERVGVAFAAGEAVALLGMVVAVRLATGTRALQNV